MVKEQNTHLLVNEKIENKNIQNKQQLSVKGPTVASITFEKYQFVSIFTLVFPQLFLLILTPQTI
jgi:hypothetical protein